MSANAIVPIDNSEKRPELMQLVSFKLGGEKYGLEVLKTREIIRIPVVTHIPNTPTYVEGIISLRGKVIPIISMRKRFNLLDIESDSHTRIIIMDVSNNLTGFIVDEVSEVIRINGSEIHPPPAFGSQDVVEQKFISGVFNTNDGILVIMDIDRMFSEYEQTCYDDFGIEN